MTSSLTRAALEADTKTLLYVHYHLVFQVLVPKKRGTGFLKVPYGHHENQALREISDRFQVEMCGLDGCLEIERMGARFIPEGTVSEIMEALGKHYGLPFKEITLDEFDRLNPVLSGRAQLEGE